MWSKRTSYLLSLIFSLICLSACGGCPKAQNAWESAKSVPSRLRSGPQWMLEVQTEEISSRLTRSKNKSSFKKSKIKLETPVPGVKLAPIKFKLSDFYWAVDGEEGVLKVTISALIKGQEILTLRMSGSSPIQLDTKAKKLRLEVRADQFKRASLKLGDGAERAMRRALKRQVPKKFRHLVPKKELIKLAKRALKKISQEGYPLIRKNILSPLGTLAKLEWSLPDYPITKMAVKVTDQVWRIGLWTTIKADGLGSKAMSRGVGSRSLKSAGARLFISAPWVAAAGNWAMATGKLPSRFNRRGEPTKKGAARATMTWNPSKTVKRPLKIHLWAGAQKPLNLCLYARAGVDPDLKIKSRKLSIKTAAKLERVEGNPLAKTAVNLSGIGERTLKWHHHSSAPSAMKVGGSKLPLRWLNVSLNRKFLMVGIDIGGGEQASFDQVAFEEEAMVASMSLAPL